MAEHSPIPLSNAYTFSVEKTVALHLPPKGLFRLRKGNFLKTPLGEFNHTLYFSSLLQQTFYQEQILRHMVSPQVGHHGPFKIDKLSPAEYQPQNWDVCSNRIEAHLRFSRFGSEPLNSQSRNNVMDFVRSCGNVPTSSLRSYELTPCRRFSAEKNSEYQHEWSHSLLEFHEYHLLDITACQFSCLIFAFD